MLEYFVFERLKNGAIIEHNDEREVATDETMEQRIGEILGLKSIGPNRGPLLFRVAIYTMDKDNVNKKLSDDELDEFTAIVMAELEYVNYLHHTISENTIILLNIKDENGSYFEIVGDDAKNAKKLLDVRGGTIAGIPFVKLGDDADTRTHLSQVAHTIIETTHDRIGEWYNRHVINKS